MCRSIFQKSFAKRYPPSRDIQSESPKKNYILIFAFMSLKISSILRMGCIGHCNKLQNPPSLVCSIWTICFKYFFQADFQSSPNFSLFVNILSINLFPKKKEFIILDGRNPRLNIFYATQKKNLEFLALAQMVQFDSLPAPAGDRKINCWTLYGYFQQQSAEMYPPKLWPTRMNDSIPAAFLHYSMAPMQYSPVYYGVILSFHLPLEERPTPKVSSACTWKYSLRCQKVRTKVREVPPQP